MLSLLLLGVVAGSCVASAAGRLPAVKATWVNSPPLTVNATWANVLRTWDVDAY